MQKKTVLLIFAVLLLAASPVLAADATPADSQSGLKIIGYVIGMGIASGLCGIGQGRAAAGAAEAIARNPSANANIRLALILGLAFIESLAIYTLVVVFLK
jgi:F-type H+-transporting ATPase subunit c